MKKNNGSIRLWFWTIVPALFVGMMFSVDALDKHFDIGDRSLDAAIGLAMTLISPFIWGKLIVEELAQMRPKAVKLCCILYGVQVAAVVGFYIYIGNANN